MKFNNKMARLSVAFYNMHVVQFYIRRHVLTELGKYCSYQGPRSDFVIGGGLASAKRELLLGGSGGMPPVKF